MDDIERLVRARIDGMLAGCWLTQYVEHPDGGEVPQTEFDADLAGQRMAELVVQLVEACAESLKVIDDCYDATGHIRTAKTSHQRLKIERAITRATGKPFES